MSGTSGLTYTAPKKSSPLQAVNKLLAENILSYAKNTQLMASSFYPLRNFLEGIDRAYMRELDTTRETARASAANKLGNPLKFQNIQVPIIMPQVRAALGYMTEVFLTGQPIFGVAANPDTESQAAQMEAIIAENSVTAGWHRQLMMFFADGLKYNLHALEVIWEQQTVASVVTDLTSPVGAVPKQVLWNGNVIRRVDPYNMFMDPRVTPAEIHKHGEFAGYTELFSRVRLKKFIEDYPYAIDATTIANALNSSNSSGNLSGNQPFGYYKPSINPVPAINSAGNAAAVDWNQWFNTGATSGNSGAQHKNAYTRTVLYARIIPEDFLMNVPGGKSPQVWKFNIINGQVVLTAERLSNAHNYIPILFGQPLEDGLDYQTKSFAANVEPMQAVSSAMANAFIAAKRRSIADRVLYDPMRVTEKDINSTDPAAKIPVRMAAYGKPVGEAVYQFPYHDNEQSAGMLQGIKVVTDMANMINGQNPAQQGQFVKGNKTLHEYDDIMGHGNVGNQMMAISTESQVFVPLKEILKLNILLYQQPAVVYNPSSQASVNIDPVSLRNMAVQFKISDGLVPTDKIIAGEEWQSALQAIASSPQIGSSYNIGPMFSYLMKLRGADLAPFEKPPQQVQYEQQMGAWQQAAAEAAKQGAAFSAPMPQPPPQQPPSASPTSVALKSTQGAQAPSMPSIAPGAPSQPQQSP